MSLSHYSPRGSSGLAANPPVNFLSGKPGFRSAHSEAILVHARSKHSCDRQIKHAGVLGLRYLVEFENLQVDLSLTKNKPIPLLGKEHRQSLAFLPLRARHKTIMKEPPKANALSCKSGNQPPLLDILGDRKLA